MLYAGSVDHSGLVQEKLSSAVIRILKDFAGKVDFTFVGANPALNDVAGVSVHPFFESYEDYQTFITDGDFTVGLAPAYDTSFYACKYYNKFIEYSSFGIAGLYENTQPYTQIVEHEKNGFLCGPSSEDWYTTLRAVLVSSERLRTVALTAQTLLLEEFSPEMVSEELSRWAPELVGFSAPRIATAEIELPPMRWIFHLERFWLMCRIYGPLSVFVVPLKTVKKLWKLLRKRVRGE